MSSYKLFVVDSDGVKHECKPMKLNPIQLNELRNEEYNEKHPLYTVTGTPFNKFRLRNFILKAGKVVDWRERRTLSHRKHCSCCLDGADCKEISYRIRLARKLSHEINSASRLVHRFEMEIKI